QPRSDFVGQLNPGGGLAGTPPCCSRETPLAAWVALPPPASAWLELARGDHDDDVLRIPAQPDSTGSSSASAAATRAGRTAARGAIRFRARARECPIQPMSLLSAVSGPAGTRLAERLPGKPGRGPPGL